jgi:hypothetical protein
MGVLLLRRKMVELGVSVLNPGLLLTHRQSIISDGNSSAGLGLRGLGREEVIQVEKGCC